MNSGFLLKCVFEYLYAYAFLKPNPMHHTTKSKKVKDQFADVRLGIFLANKAKFIDRYLFFFCFHYYNFSVSFKGVKMVLIRKRYTGKNMKMIQGLTGFINSSSLKCLYWDLFLANSEGQSERSGGRYPNNSCKQGTIKL